MNSAAPPARPLRILGVAGSLRPDSFNRALLRAAAERAPEGVRITVFDLAPVPLYNVELDHDEARPEGVVRLKSAIAEADGLLLATPEYNAGISGVLKNALDWASRPAFRSPMAGLPTGMMGASPGSGGTTRAQEQLKLVLLAMLAEVFPHGGVAVARCRAKFDDGPTLTDPDTLEVVAKYLQGFSDWVRGRKG